MASITKPKIYTPKLERNAIGLTRLDYEGGMSTLCAGCGHDSITAAIVQTFFELAIRRPLPIHAASSDTYLSWSGC